jgi:hypothetical protein
MYTQTRSNSHALKSSDEPYSDQRIAAEGPREIILFSTNQVFTTSEKVAYGKQKYI